MKSHVSKLYNTQHYNTKSNFSREDSDFWEEKNTKPRFFSQYQKFKPIQNVLMEMFSLQDVQPVTEQFI